MKYIRALRVYDEPKVSACLSLSIDSGVGRRMSLKTHVVGTAHYCIKMRKIGRIIQK